MKSTPRACPTCGRARFGLTPRCWESWLSRPTFPCYADIQVLIRDPLTPTDHLRLYLGTRYWRGELTNEVLEEALGSGVPGAGEVVRGFGDLRFTPYEDILEERARAGWPVPTTREPLGGA